MNTLFALQLLQWNTKLLIMFINWINWGVWMHSLHDCRLTWIKLHSRNELRTANCEVTIRFCRLVSHIIGLKIRLLSYLYRKLWISIPIQDDWLALSWLVNVSWSVILASYHHVLQMFSTAARFVRSHLEFCIAWDKTQWFLLFLMSPLHCLLNWEVF